MDEFPQSCDGRMYALTCIIPIMVARAAILTLIAILDAVFVHEWNYSEVDVCPQPSACTVVSQHLFQKSFQLEACDAFAGVMPRRQQYTQVVFG